MISRDVGHTNTDNLHPVGEAKTMRQSTKQTCLLSACRQLMSLHIWEKVQADDFDRRYDETPDAGSVRHFEHGRFPRRLP